MCQCAAARMAQVDPYCPGCRLGAYSQEAAVIAPAGYAIRPVPRSMCGMVSWKPRYPSRTTYPFGPVPGDPDFPKCGYPVAPPYPGYPVYPSYPSFPGYPVFPQWPILPGNPAFPQGGLPGTPVFPQGGGLPGTPVGGYSPGGSQGTVVYPNGSGGGSFTPSRR